MQKINKLLSDASFEVRIRRLKALGLKNGGIEKAADWVIYAIENGYDHLVDKDIQNYVKRDPFNLLKFVFFGLVIGGIAYASYTYNSQIPSVSVISKN